MPTGAEVGATEVVTERWADASCLGEGHDGKWLR